MQRIRAGTDDRGQQRLERTLAAELLKTMGMNIKKGQGRHRGYKSKALLLVDCMWDERFLHGECKMYMIEKVRKHLRTHVFTPWKILKAMDVASFKLSLARIEVLRRCEAPSKYSKGTLPSKSTILLSARKLEAHAMHLCPFTMIGKTFSDDDVSLRDNDSFQAEIENERGSNDIVGEGFELDATMVTKLLFKAFGLINESKRRPVELSLASDGAQLKNSVTHVAAGLKFNDMAMHDPLTKQPMLLHSPDPLVQSRNLCFPLRIVIAKDSKKTLEGFRPLYDSYNSGDIGLAFGSCPFKISYPGDMKLQWGALDEGGAAKVKEKLSIFNTVRSTGQDVMSRLQR